MEQLAIIGLGRWGKNLIREFSTLARVTIAQNLGDTQNILWLKKNYQHIKSSTKISDIINDSKIDAIVIATPISTHFKIAKDALSGNKHVFVEKPPAIKFSQTQQLLKMARNKGLALFVDNTLLYDPVFQKMDHMLDKKQKLEINFQWQKWGTFEENINWNLTYHAVCLSIYLLGSPNSFETKDKPTTDKVRLDLKFRNGESHIFINRAFKGTPSQTIAVQNGKNHYLIDRGKLYKNGKLQLVEHGSALNFTCRQFIKETRSKKKNYRNFSLSAKTVKALEKIENKLNI